MAISLDPAERANSGDVMRAIPPEFYEALPYVVTIIVLAWRSSAGASRRPPSGKPYDARGRT